MSEYGEITAPDTVRFERLLPGPIERVFSYLVDGEKRALWLASGVMEPRVGARFSMRFRHSELSDEPGEPPAAYKPYEGGVDSPTTGSRNTIRRVFSPLPGTTARRPRRSCSNSPRQATGSASS